MPDGSGTRVRSLIRWSGAIVAITAAIILAVTMAAPPQARLEGLNNPLAPPDTESPRATFAAFTKEIEAVERGVRDAYYEHINSPGWFQSQATKDKIRIIQAHLDRAVRCLDLSEVPPGNRGKVAMEAAMMLEEIFDQVGSPALASIPDLAAIKARVAAGERPQWTVPNTEIRIARVESGQRTGEYLFTAGSIARAYEYYQKVRHVPPSDNFDFYPFYSLSPGDLTAAEMVFAGSSTWPCLAVEPVYIDQRASGNGSRCALTLLSFAAAFRGVLCFHARQNNAPIVLPDRDQAPARAARRY